MMSRKATPIWDREGRGWGIAVIADIARHRRDREAKTIQTTKDTKGHKGWEGHTQKSRLAAGSLHNVVECLLV